MASLFFVSLNRFTTDRSSPDFAIAFVCAVYFTFNFPNFSVAEVGAGVKQPLRFRLALIIMFYDCFFTFPNTCSMCLRYRFTNEVYNNCSYKRFFHSNITHY